MYKDVLKVYRKGLKTVVAGKAEKKNIVTFDVWKKQTVQL